MRRGVDFAMQQISSGIAVFRDMLSDNLVDIADLVSQCEDDEVATAMKKMAPMMSSNRVQSIE